MLVGVCTMEIRIPLAASLKDKRRVVKSLKDRIRSRYNVSVAEVDHQDNIKVATLGMATVSNETIPIHRTFNEIRQSLIGYTEAELIFHRVEVF